jgi:hypothetical protein
MKSQALPEFWKLYDQLPQQIRRRAGKAYRLWQQNPRAGGLRFKRVGKTRPVYSVRISEDYRALALVQGDMVTWFWIGHHNEYDRLLKAM